MAEGGKKQLLCRFFANGYCREQNACQFSHSRETGIPVPENVCWYYLQGKCSFKDQCRFLHQDAGLTFTSEDDEADSTDCLSSDYNGPITSQNSPLTTSNRTADKSESASSPSFLVSTPCSSSSTSHYPKFIEAEVIPRDTINNKVYSNSSKSSTSISPLTLCPSTGPFCDDKYCPIMTTTTNTTSSSSSANNDETTLERRQPSEDSGYGDQSIQEPSCEILALGISSCSISQPATSTTTAAAAAVDGQSSRSYADALKDKAEILEELANTPLCPFSMTNPDCPYGDTCKYMHGQRCEMCDCLCLHPHNAEQRKKHHEECVKEHERQMETAFAVKRSLDKACGICMDIIMEKEPPTERRFGILEKCSHIFCLNCIRKWRQTKQFDNKTIRACPECRVSSDFVIPNQYWVDTPEEKDKLIDNYKQNLSLKPCKYFKQGRGECPFAGACFYMHAYPDGTLAEMPPPRARRRQAQDGELETIRDMLLWNYLEAREDRQFLLTLDLEDMMDFHEMGFFSDETDDDDTDFTDYLLD